jgi:hypothetical protein
MRTAPDRDRLSIRPLALGLLAIGLLTIPRLAVAEPPPQEVRILKLADGRLLTGRVLMADAKGMKIEVPQGLITVPYTSLAEVEVIDAADYASQAPLRIAVAPVIPGNNPQSLARGADTWLPDLVALVPHTTVSSAKQWAQALADRGTELHACSGQADCLRPLAADLGIDRIVIAKLGDGASAKRTLEIRTVVVSSGGSLRPAFPKLQIVGGQMDPTSSSGELLSGVFRALGFEASIDTVAVAQAAFPPSDEDVLTARGATSSEVPSAAPRSDTGGGAAPRTIKTTTIQTNEIKARPLARERGLTRRPSFSQRQAVGLAFVPVPGLASALMGDRRGFALSLVGTLALSGATVYATGRFARTAEGFWLSAVVLPYAVCVGLNQLSLAIARGRSGVPRLSQRRRRPRLPRAVVAPLLSVGPEARVRPAGASLWLSGDF